MTRPMIFLCSYLSSSFLVLATLVSSVNSGQAWLVPFLFLVFGCVSPASACSDFSLPSCCNLMGHLWEMLLGTVPIRWTLGAENKNNRVFLWLQNLLVSGFHILEQNPPQYWQVRHSKGQVTLKLGVPPSGSPTRQLFIPMYTCFFLTSCRFSEAVASKFLAPHGICIPFVRTLHHPVNMLVATSHPSHSSLGSMTAAFTITPSDFCILRSLPYPSALIPVSITPARSPRPHSWLTQQSGCPLRELRIFPPAPSGGTRWIS